MLSFDIETTGLDPREHRITCAAVFDPDREIERCFVFEKGDDPEEFMAILDSSPVLCAFNGAGFDIPFIHSFFKVDNRRVAAWREKLHDVYEGCRSALAVTFPLQKLLELNKIPGKTGSGADAIQLARDARWDELAEYCLNDVRSTHAVSTLPLIQIPKTHGVFMTPRGEFRVVRA